jgi:hypothetical protein
MKDCGDEPGPDIEELRARFSENADEYARVRAIAAVRLGSSDKEAWESVACQLVEEQTLEGD